MYSPYDPQEETFAWVRCEECGKIFIEEHACPRCGGEEFSVADEEDTDDYDEEPNKTHFEEEDEFGGMNY